MAQSQAASLRHNDEPLTWDPSELHLADHLEEMSHAGIRRCYQCLTCSGGCPFFAAMDLGPHGVMRMILLGQRQEVFTCNTIWLCVGCHTCAAACPMAIDIAAVMDACRTMALRENAAIEHEGILDFHREVLSSVERYGRAHKLGIMLGYKRAQGGWLSDVEAGLKMLKARKLDLLPSRVEDREELKKLFAKPWRR